MAASEIMKFYKTGVDGFDEDHLALLTLLDTLAYSETAEETSKIIQSIFTELVQHTKDEEEFMEKINFPQTEYHKRAHRAMIRDIGDLSKEIKANDIRFITSNVVKIVNIIKDHIEWCDIPYGEYVKKMNTQNTSTNT